MRPFSMLYNSPVYHRIKSLILHCLRLQYFRYLLSGSSAAFLEVTSNWAMLHSGMAYLNAAKISGGIGLLCAFLFHKFFAFKKKEQTSKQVIRYVILQGCNYIAQIYMIYLFVEFAGVPPFFAKILAIAITVLWNFFVYKFFVYA